MDSTKNEESSFSMSDFEKGLMLAGFIPPASVEEFNERERLEGYEKQLKEESRKLYFKRVVLAAEIVSRLYDEITFGRIKFQKLVYLCEHVIHMNVQNRYKKQMAGPFDNKFMHSIVKEFEKNNWFAVEEVKEGKFTRSKYTPLPDCGNHKKYYDSYFTEQHDNINYIIELFRKEKTDITEIAATLYACSLELKTNNIAFSEQGLLELFYNWSERKGNYEKNRVLSTWQWMKQKGLAEEW